MSLTTLSRRQMLKVSAGALLAAGLWPGRLRAADPPTKPLKFIVVNDFHYSEPACTPFFEGLIKRFNEESDVAFVIIAGDLLDAGNAVQAKAIHEILAQLKVPYHVSPGNHDSATQTDRSAFNETFGSTMNYTFEANGWQFIGLDTSDGVKVEKFDVLKPTLDFAAGLPTKLDASKPTFLFTHFPLGPGVRYRLQNADTVLEPLKAFNLQHIFNGHYHAFTQKTLASTIVTTNRCCSRKRANHDNTWQKGFFVIDAAEGKFTRTFVEYGTDFPGGLQPPASTRRPGTNAATLPAVAASQPAY